MYIQIPFICKWASTRFHQCGLMEKFEVRKYFWNAFLFNLVLDDEDFSDELEKNASSKQNVTLKIQIRLER
ncbi:hypothetical protein WN48_03536 [Eufriesea mexicana]|uniref:Uncharacterized protein n=1 Tax=Eufriesea mexicana TaxID=516756 RepID=A0A310SAR7_9HYME|nr:hypothetical protein WN48_03536 [Eufriesea mexicana]